MSEFKGQNRNKTVIGQEVISKKGAVMKVTRLRLSQKGSDMLRSTSSGIVSKRDKEPVREVEEAHSQYG